MIMGMKAFGAIGAMSDRICIHSNGSVNARLSPQNLISCCWSCGFGCNGGFPGAAWRYWVHRGIVTGGSYNSSQVNIFQIRTLIIYFKKYYFMVLYR